MAFVPTTGSDGAVDHTTGSVGGLRWFVFALFFIFGGITSLNDIIIPKLREIFTLTHASSMLVQSAFFIAYALFSIPAAAIVRRFGYMRTASIGLMTMTAGCLLFVPASEHAAFSLFLFALFVLGAGITIVQVVANPLVSMLGAPGSAHSRLTFAQAFNSLGTTVFPLVGSAVILGNLARVDSTKLSGVALDAYRRESSSVVVHTYLGLALALTIVAGVVWTQRHKLKHVGEVGGGLFSGLSLLKRPRFAFGTAAIFLYVGAEVALGSLIVNYLVQPSVLGVSDQVAGNHVPFYWGGALLGRFVGAYVLRQASPSTVLISVAVGAIFLLLASGNTTGPIAAWTLLSVGLMNAVMFPTIFSLASEGLGARAAEGSGVIATAIVGGAIIPLVTGKVADITNSLSIALILPGLCYCAIVAFGIYARSCNTTN
ncbi:MAG: glucose/galactose MFS transporter [Oxalobacteraceae bacterium]|nr:MAG: glucose/galactose MFS transporter [Oxalobacteraceae bacterium]